MRFAALLILALVAVGAGGRGDTAFEDGLRAYGEGRHRDALEAWLRAEAERGDATPELLVDQALAALGANDLATAEGAARRAAEAAADTPRAAEFAGLRDFLLGNVAFARVQRAKALADLPDADPKVLQGAIAQADAARRAWELAATSRADWPAARRNVERALLELEALRGRAPSAPPQDGPDEMKKDEDPQAKPAGPDGPPPGEPPKLEPEQLQNLLERLAELEQEKRDARRSRAGEGAASVERDW